MLAVAVIDKTDNVEQVQKVVTLLLSLFVETYDPGHLKMFDAQIFEGFIPTIDEVLQKGDVTLPFEELSSQTTHTTIDVLAESVGNYDILSKLMRLLLVREPIIILHQDSCPVFRDLWMLVPHRRYLVAKPDLSQFQSIRIIQEINQRFEDELIKLDIPKCVLFIPEANEKTLEALSEVPKGWVAVSKYLPESLKKSVSQCILEDGKFYRYVFGERTEITFSDLLFESNLLKEAKEKQFTYEAFLRFMRLKEQELENKSDLAQSILESNPEILYDELIEKSNIKSEEFELILRLLAAERGMQTSQVLMSAHYDYLVKVKPILSTILADSKKLDVILKETNPVTLAIVMMADGKKTMNNLLRNISSNLKPYLDKSSLWENLSRLADVGVLELIPRDDVKVKLSQW